LSVRLGRVSDRLVPLLAFLLLQTPLGYVGLICHEGGHGMLALAQGGTFTGILITQSGSYAMAASHLISIGGWAGQYALAIAALLLLWARKPKSFLGRSVLTALIVQNLVNEPPYIASLQSDSAATLKLLEATGIGEWQSVATIETVALVLGLVGGYMAWKVFRSYLSGMFRWIGTRRAGLASLLFVAGSAAVSWLAYLAPAESVLVTSTPFQALSFVAFLVLFSVVVIPPEPVEPTGKWEGWPSKSAGAFVVLLFIEAQLVYFFALPIWLPFP
jgi:hypothetical protein